MSLILLIGLFSIMLTAFLCTNLLDAFATTEEPRVLNGTLQRLPTNEQTNQPLIQSQPIPMPQANQSQPQWLWTTGGGNSYTLPYPSNWKVEEKPRVTPFDNVETVFTTDKGNRLSVSISPASVTNMEDFKSYNNLMSSGVTTALPDATVEGSGFGYYSLGGLETFGMLLSIPSEIPGVYKKALDLRTFINGWEVELIYAAPDYNFNSEMPVVQQIIDSFYFNA